MPYSIIPYDIPPYNLYPVPYVLCPMSYVLYPIPYTLGIDFIQTHSGEYITCIITPARCAVYKNMLHIDYVCILCGDRTVQYLWLCTSCII